MEFKDKLKEYRLKARLTQDELSRATGISRAAIAGYETGRREPSFEVLEILSDFFNRDIDIMLGRKEDDGLTYFQRMAVQAVKEMPEAQLVAFLEFLGKLPKGEM